MTTSKRQNNLAPLPAEGIAGAVPEAGGAGCSLTDRIDVTEDIARIEATQ